MKVHELKSWPEFFTEILTGKKCHDLRQSIDRVFEVGDHLRLREFNRKIEQYTGRETIVEVTYITSQISPCAYSETALNKGFCILSIKLIG